MSEHDDRAADSIQRNPGLVHVVRDLNTAVGALTAAARAQLDTIEALEHRIVVLEGRMENALARLDGHDLGFATLHLDDAGKAALARMQRLGRTMDPDEEGTSRS